MIRFLVIALAVASANAATSCYTCAFADTGCGIGASFTPGAGGVVETPNCAGTCQTITRTTAANVATYARSCQTVAETVRCVDAVDGTDTLRTCNCNTEFCNGATNLADRAISCYTCTKDQPWCLLKPLPANTPTPCTVGQVCVTTKKENVFGDLITYDRKCSADAHTPSTKCVYTVSKNGDVESRCYCSNPVNAGAACNDGVDEAWEPTKQPKLQCYSCTGDLNSKCAMSPFKPYEAPVSDVDTCNPETPCVTTRTRVTTDGGAVTETVTRGCKTVADTETETCKYDVTVANTVTSRCYCKTDRCNVEQSSLVEPNCYKCGSGTTPAEIAACLTVPTDATFPINGVSLGPCPTGVPCFTTKTVTPTGIATVVRGCGLAPSTDRCEYTTLANGNKQSTCYSNARNSNGGLTNVNAPTTCISCTSDTAVNLAACSAATPTGGNVRDEVCTTGVCLTTKSKTPAGAESYVRKCAPVDTKTTGCVYNANGLTSDCYCTGLRCNDQLTSVTQPPTAVVPPTATGPVCFSCAFTDAACKGANYNGATTICEVNEKCVTTKRRETNNDETVSRGCTTVTVATCTYTGKVGEQRVGTCVCDGTRCNNADIRYEAEPPAGTQKPNNSAMALTPAFVSMVLLAVASLFL